MDVQKIAHVAYLGQNDALGLGVRWSGELFINACHGNSTHIISHHRFKTVSPAATSDLSQRPDLRGWSYLHFNPG